MEEKERKILAILSKNSRIAKTQLAKQAGISQETLSYQLNQLEKKYQLSYFTNINYQAIGFERYGIFLQLKNISKKEEEKFFKELDEHNFTSYIGPLIGKWNIVFDIYAKSKDQLHQLVDEILSPIKNKVEQLIINTSYIPEEFYQSKLFGEKYISKKTIQKEHIKIDETDKQLLSLLSHNARISYAELSTHMNMSANGIKKRIKKLEQNNIILGYGLGIHLFTLGYELYVLQLKTQETIKEKLQTFLQQHKQTLFSYYYMGLGDWDADIGIFVKKPKEVRKVIGELKEQFGEHLQIQNMYIVGDITKENVTPIGVFE